MKRFLLVAWTLVALAGATPCAAEGAWDDLKFLPIQHDGRVKPFDAFARRTLRLVTGGDAWQKKPAAAFLLETLADRHQRFAEIEWIRVDHGPLKTHLGLDPVRRYFSLAELSPLEGRIVLLVRAADGKRKKDLRPTPLEQKAEELYSKVLTVHELASGEAWTVIPPSKGHAWTSPYPATGESAARYRAMVEAGRSSDSATTARLSAEWMRQLSAGAHASEPKLRWEVRYHEWSPFSWAAALYFLAAFTGLLAARRSAALTAAGVTAAGAAFVLHTLGLALRVYLLDRPPVSNMYESMVFASWVVVVLAVVLSLAWRRPTALWNGAILGGLVVLYARLLPLDESLDVLVPVLRSNYWLTIHVLTIVASYGAFALALGLGHRHLWMRSFGRPTPSEIDESTRLIERLIQFGTILIGTGTVLGGVWANESWGRFWGWDPKETWALITFLGYLVVVHLRFTRRLGDRGLALATIAGFQLVLFTWYGVNFVLGRGLHSYGFGAGGMEWILYFLVFEALFTTAVLVKRPARGAG